MAFGLTTTSTRYIVDTDAGVEFSIIRGGTLTSTVHLGDLTSFKLNGVEFAAPFSSPSRYSHFESGLSSSAVLSATVDPAGNWIKIAADDTTATAGAGGTGVIQYYVAKRGDPMIYMATYAPEMKVSSTRFITYLDWSKFPNHPDPSDTSAIHGTPQTTIESGDVFRDPVDGHTHSKYYAENRLIGHVYHGATGPSSGAFMFIGNRESGSGGPFWKDIDFQSTGSAVELYNMPYSDHSQTEAFRPGLHGPYALVLTNGSAPTVTPNYSFMDGIGITGLVPASGRGTLTGTISGITPGRVPTVGLSNTTAQYWATPDASGNFSIAGIKPGTYTQTLYEEELAVGTKTVTISAGVTTTSNIISTYYRPTTIWQIGTWDGTPREFLNGDKITDMHPSDPRMAQWVNTTFTVGTSTDNQWPMAQWKDPTLNPTNTIQFTLTAAQAATPLSLRIGLTRTGVNGRPTVNANSGLYNSGTPGISTQPGTRGVTLGSWRGNNVVYTYNIPTSALHEGVNTLAIGVNSGSSGTTYLSPWVIFDAIDLVPTSSLTNAPVVSSITLSPSLTPTLEFGEQKQFTATARDQFGNITPVNITWTATQGIIDDNGLFTAPGTAGTVTVKATSGSIFGSRNASIVAPLAVSGTFEYLTAQAAVFSFNRSVNSTMLQSGLVLQNLTTMTSVPFSFEYSGQIARLTFASILADGNYRATIPANSTQDSFGKKLSQDYTFNFHVLAGDANRDRVVNVLDMYLVSQNWFGTGKNFEQGDFNYDTVVDSADLGIVGQRWLTVLEAPVTPPPPPPPAPAPAETASVSATSLVRQPPRKSTRLISLVP